MNLDSKVSRKFDIYACYGESDELGRAVEEAISVTSLSLNRYHRPFSSAAV